MAVIKIPSKHIYEMQNEKVIDNDIDKIEVGVNTPAIINDTENVYNETVSGIFSNRTEQTDTENGTTYSVVSGDNAGKTYSALAYVAIRPNYISKTIYVPNDIKNGKVTSLLTGKGENDEPNIKYSLYGTTNIGNAQAQGAVIRNIDSSYTYANSVINITPTDIVTKTDIGYNLPSTDISITYNSPAINATTHKPMSSATAEINLIREDNIITANAEPTDSGWILNLTFLSGLRIIKLSGLVNAKLGDISNPDFTGLYTDIYGTYEEYIPKQLEVSFYGNTISLDLTENTITIGSGKQVLSFSGNELMQTTNSPTIQDNYQKIINYWGNGKETATLRVGIADYYGDWITLVDKYYDRGQVAVLSPATGLEVGQNLQLPNGSVVYVQSIVDNKAYCSATPSTELPEIGSILFFANLLISKEGKNGLPMTFQIGDIVEPYVYGANGKDRPMSINKDGTPKNFEVQSKRIIYDGAVWQEIGLQEHIILTAVLRMGSELVSDDGYYHFSMRYISGTKPAIGDIISFEGEIAEVIGKDTYVSNLFYLRAKFGGKFNSMQIGTTITVEFI